MKAQRIPAALLRSAVPLAAAAPAGAAGEAKEAAIGITETGDCVLSTAAGRRVLCHQRAPRLLDARWMRRSTKREGTFEFLRRHPRRALPEESRKENHR